MTDHHLRYALDAAAVAGTIGSLAGWLPPIAALLSIVWLSMQIFAWVKRKEWRDDRRG